MQEEPEVWYPCSAFWRLTLPPNHPASPHGHVTLRPDGTVAVYFDTASVTCG